MAAVGASAVLLQDRSTDLCLKVRVGYHELDISSFYYSSQLFRFSVERYLPCLYRASITPKHITFSPYPLRVPFLVVGIPILITTHSHDLSSSAGRPITFTFHYPRLPSPSTSIKPAKTSPGSSTSRVSFVSLLLSYCLAAMSRCHACVHYGTAASRIYC